MLRILQILLFPFSILYESVLRLRNYLYDSGIFGTTEFDIPTINVGNLAFGGTGKTPHIEYLIRLLENTFQVAVLSRGYKRKTSGYVFANEQATTQTLGDEPFQIHSKFASVAVAVSENRVLGLPNLLMDAPQTQVVLLDDAFQHRAIKPGLNILLTEYKNLYSNDYLVPSGYLREYRSGSKRADIIVVTKCPDNLNEAERLQVKKALKPLQHQQIFFSLIEYGNLISFSETKFLGNPKKVFAWCGLANGNYFKQHLEGKYDSVEFWKFPDHHVLTEDEFNLIVTKFDADSVQEKILLTTEKDYQKLLQTFPETQLQKLPLYYLPIQVKFHQEDETAFNQLIINYVTKNNANN